MPKDVSKEGKSGGVERTVLKASGCMNTEVSFMQFDLTNILIKHLFYLLSSGREIGQNRLWSFPLRRL